MNNILETDFDCNGESTTVSTPQNPGETLDELADRHDIEVRQAAAKCTSSAIPPLPIATSWTAKVGTIRFSSAMSVGQAQHNQDVAVLKLRYPAA